MDKDVAAVAHKVILSTMPSYFLQSFNDSLRAYLTGQKYLKVFLYQNLSLCISYPIQGYLFIWWFGFGVYGFGVICFLREIITLIVLITYLKNYGQEQEKKFEEKFSEIRMQFCSYLKMYVKIWFNQYIPYLGFDINTILLGQLKDNNSQAAWSSVQSLCSFGYALGGGCGQRGTSIVCNLVGEKKTKQAKHIATKSWIATFILAITWSIILYTCSNKIPDFYLEVPEAKENLSYMLKILALVVLSDVMININMSQTRLVGYSNLISCVVAFDSILIFDGLTSIFFFVFNFKGYAIIYSFQTGNTLTFTVCVLIVFFYSDWSKIAIKKL